MSMSDPTDSHIYPDAVGERLYAQSPKDIREQNERRDASKPRLTNRFHRNPDRLPVISNKQSARIRDPGPTEKKQGAYWRRPSSLSDHSPYAGQDPFILEALKENIILWQWLPKVFCCLLSVVCTVTIIPVLIYYDNKRLPPPLLYELTLDKCIVIWFGVSTGALIGPVYSVLTQFWAFQGDTGREAMKMRDFEISESSVKAPWTSFLSWLGMCNPVSILVGLNFFAITFTMAVSSEQIVYISQAHPGDGVSESSKLAPGREELIRVQWMKLALFIGRQTLVILVVTESAPWRALGFSHMKERIAAIIKGSISLTIQRLMMFMGLQDVPLRPGTVRLRWTCVSLILSRV
jgi:hypothetical protein